MLGLLRRNAVYLGLIGSLLLLALTMDGHPSRCIILLAAGLDLGAWTLTLHSLPRLRQSSAAPRSLAYQVALLGLMAGLAAILQSAPAFVPGVGLLLATLSSLPIAVGTLAAPDGAPAMVGAAIALLVILQPDEAFIFALTTAPLGIMTAVASLDDPPWWKGALLPGMALGSGMILMSYLIGIPSLGPVVHGLGPVWAPAIYYAFGYAYASLWVGLLRVYRHHLRSL